MEIGKATAIFKNIGQVAASDAEKIEAINEVLAMPTHNGITKTDVLHALKWVSKYCLFLDCQNFSLNNIRKFQKNDIDRLERRLKHLLKSNFIRSFDEVNPITKEYKRDIREADSKILYLCNGDKCGPDHDCLECKHTTDITHAKHFEYDGCGRYWEKSESVRNCPKVSDESMRLIDANALLNEPGNVYHTEFGDAVIDVADIEKAPTIEIPTAELDVQTTNISLIAGPNGIYTGCINCYAHIVPNPHFKFCPECGRKIV